MTKTLVPPPHMWIYVYHSFTHVLQGSFAGIGAITTLLQNMEKGEENMHNISEWKMS